MCRLNDYYDGLRDRLLACGEGAMSKQEKSDEDEYVTHVVEIDRFSFEALSWLNLTWSEGEPFFYSVLNISTQEFAACTYITEDQARRLAASLISHADEVKRKNLIIKNHKSCDCHYGGGPDCSRSIIDYAGE